MAIKTKLPRGVVAAIALAGSAAAQALHPLPPQPEGLAWPTEAWETAALEDGVDAGALDAVIEETMARGVGDVMGETRGMVIIHRGRLVREAYGEGFGPETKQVSWSMAKSVTQALVGRAAALGLIGSIDAPMPSPWPQDDPRAAITWRQWLNMTDGLDYTEIGATDLVTNDVVQMMFGPGRFDVAAFMAERPPLHAPGTVWNYSTGGIHLVARALQSDVWLGADPRTTASWTDENLFGPIGMDHVIEFDPAGTFLGGSYVWASPRDFAKFGYLYLRDGVWEGERLLPEGWVDFARTETPGENANVYGAGWWITPPEDVERSHSQAALTCPCDAFHAGGNEGQTIWVVPSKDLVIVRLGLMPNSGKNWGALYEWNQEIARLFPDIVIEDPGGALLDVADADPAPAAAIEQ